MTPHLRSEASTDSEITPQPSRRILSGLLLEGLLSDFDLISERVKNGLANARAKGKLIGRKKLRDSDLIRKLLKAGVTYRRIAEIANCSHGSVHAEKVAMKSEEAKLAQKTCVPETVFPEIPSAS